MVGPERDHGDLRYANDMNAVDIFAPLFDVAGSLDDFAGGLDVALAAVGD